jgi:D-alanyl-D-alanine carboxypeptidase
VRISRKAASEPPSKLGLKREGQKIALRHLIRAAAIKSANDAATAIGEAIEGSEAAFARRMNRTAQALGMTRTTFKNAHGLTRRATCPPRAT